MIMDVNNTILVAGARGMVGSALVRLLSARGYTSLLTPSRIELDCTNQDAVYTYLLNHKPDIIIVAAAKVGGIYANNTYPVDFIATNLMIATNMIHGAHEANIDRLLFLGSTCIYPKNAPQPINEDSLLTGPLEPTNEAYALAKIAGVKMCQHYRTQYGRSYFSVMPTNLYGPGDYYHNDNAHVLPALLRRFHDAATDGDDNVTIWGTGNAKREFLYVDDLADACVFLLEKPTQHTIINVGSHEEITIIDLAHKIASLTNFSGTITTDTTKPDGMPRKKTDLSRITSFGWQPHTTLDIGLSLTYQHFLEHVHCLRT